MLPILLFLFIVMPVIEVMVLVEVYQRTSFVTTLMIVVVTGTIGAILAKAQGLMVMRDIQQDLADGRTPTPRMLDGLMILFAGVLLITPGLITDAAGFLLLLQPIRYAIRMWMKHKCEEKLRSGSWNITFRG